MEKYIEVNRDDGVINVKIKREITLQYLEKDTVGISFGMAQLYRSGIGSTREIGKIFAKSGVTVLRKKRKAEAGGMVGVQDGRLKNGRKIKITKEDKFRIVKIVFQDLIKKDKDILEEINSEKNEKEKISEKTLRRYLTEIGLRKLQDELRIKEVPKEEKREVPKVGALVPKVGSMEEQKKKSEVVKSRYAGMYLGLMVLARIGFFEVIKNIKEYSPGLREEWELEYSLQELSFLLYFLYATGERQRVYDLESVAHKEYAGLIGRKEHMLSSGCEKRLEELAEKIDIEKFEDAATTGIIKSRLITVPEKKWPEEKALQVLYTDTHVSEVNRIENISMAMHGIKRRKVKAINKHYIVTGGEQTIPIMKKLTEGKRRLSQVLLEMVPKLKAYFNDTVNLVIGFDKGGASKKVLTLFNETKSIKYVVWGSRFKWIKEIIEKIPLSKYTVDRKEEIKNRVGKIKKKIVEKICETTINYKGVGVLRTVVVYFCNTKEKAWLYTNLAKKECSSLQVREIIRFKQHVENFFKSRKCYGAMDCFGGGKAYKKKNKKPELKKILRQIKQTGHILEETRCALQGLNMSYSSSMIENNPYKIGQRTFINRIQELEKKIKKLNEIKKWVEGGKKPDFILTPYELDLRKERILTEFQDWAYIVKNEVKKEFTNEYKKVLSDEKLSTDEIKTRLNNLDDTKIYNELNSLGGELVWDKKNKTVHVKLMGIKNHLRQKALDLMCKKISSQKLELDFGKQRKYIFKISSY